MGLEWLFSGQLIVAIATATVTSLVVVFHYEVLSGLNAWCHHKQISHSGRPRRPTILLTMFMLLFAHIVEIWAFGVTFWLLLEVGGSGLGRIVGYDELRFLDCIYYSASNYTTVGWGDLATTVHVRFLAGTESLVGFMAITWSASFSYLVMARAWGLKQ